MAEHLLNCPFCGAEPGNSFKSVIVEAIPRKTIGYGIPCEPYTEYRVHCMACGAKIGGNCTGYHGILKRVITDDEARQTVINKWNRRTEPCPPSA